MEETALAPSLPTAAPTPQPIVIAAPASGSGMVIGLLVLAAGGYFVYKQYQKYKQDKETQTANTDPDANLARQINAELSAIYTNDDMVISLYKQIGDFNSVATHYRTITGKDILEHTKAHVSASAYKQILNLIGYSKGAFKPKEKQTKDVVQKAGFFIVAKADTYLRKTPVIPTCSRFVPDRLCYLENVITPVKAGDYLGVSTADNIRKQGEFTDKKSGVIFIEVEVTDQDDIKKKYKGYIASSRVNTYTVFDKTWNWLRIAQTNYDKATAPMSGLGLINLL